MFRVGGLDDVGLDVEIVADEVGGVGVVCEDAAYLGCGEDDELGLLCGEERGDGGVVEEVELGVGARDEVGVAETGEFADDGRAYQAAVSGDVDAGFEGHVGHSGPFVEASRSRGEKRTSAAQAAWRMNVLWHG